MTHQILRYREEHSDRKTLVEDFCRIRTQTEALAGHLEPEDMVIQPMPDASPTKWHLAHVTWFFEEFVLPELIPEYRVYNDHYRFLFNSYYESVGQRWERPRRGLLSRPSVSDVLTYRQAVTERVVDAIDAAEPDAWENVAPIFELGLHHEQQHQELLCTDIKYTLSLNPLPIQVFPGRPSDLSSIRNNWETSWIDIEERLQTFGAETTSFVFDNELPSHQRFQPRAKIASHPVTNGQYLEFIEDGGYERPEFWLSDGWAWVQREGIEAPLYWRRDSDRWSEYTLHGLIPLHIDGIACHISAYEAHAYCSWAGKRLPTEFELEILARSASTVAGHFLQPGGLVHPARVSDTDLAQHVYGSVWEWSSSNYVAYPGFKLPAGAVAEYNAKFMSGQLVLRGGSCATPEGHIRPTYRNFFPPEARWQFTGIRCAIDVE